MVEIGHFPRERLVADLAILRPPLGKMMWVLRAFQILLMAGLALDRGAEKITHLSAGVTAEASHGRVRADEWEASFVVRLELPARRPIAFVVALETTAPQLTTMIVLVASNATLLGKAPNGATVVVATQATSLRVSATQDDSGFLPVVVLKILANGVPVTFLVAQRTVGGEKIVRHDGTILGGPLLAGNGPVSQLFGGQRAGRCDVTHERD
ncbi:MAG: hypothetical protein KDA60_19505 [Planctomycetales bacterium]|nr:hypothetical protein [Planctomycetales bacterium]